MHQKDISHQAENTAHTHTHPLSGSRTKDPSSTLQHYVSCSVKNTFIKINEMNPAATHCTDTNPMCKEDVILTGEEKELASTSLINDSGEGQRKERRAILLHESERNATPCSRVMYFSYFTVCEYFWWDLH